MVATAHDVLEDEFVLTVPEFPHMCARQVASNAAPSRMLEAKMEKLGIAGRPVHMTEMGRLGGGFESCSMFWVSDRAGMPVARTGDRLLAAAGGIPLLRETKMAFSTAFLPRRSLGIFRGGIRSD